MSRASEYFGLMLTEMRNSGLYCVDLSDAACAVLIRDALGSIEPDSEAAANTAEALELAFDRMVGDDELVCDNGENPG